MAAFKLPAALLTGGVSYGEWMDPKSNLNAITLCRCSSCAHTGLHVCVGGGALCIHDSVAFFLPADISLLNKVHTLADLFLVLLRVWQRVTSWFLVCCCDVGKPG